MIVSGDAPYREAGDSRGGVHCSASASGSTSPGTPSEAVLQELVAWLDTECACVGDRMRNGREPDDPYDELVAEMTAQKRKAAVDDRAITLEDFAPLQRRFDFTIDAAASASNARLPRFWTAEDDALRQSWAGERVWCNPPYSDIEPWVRKAWQECRSDLCPLIVMLLPANRTEQGWWQRHVEVLRGYSTKFHVEFLPGRMRFDRPGVVIGPKGDRPPFGCCLLIWAAS